MKSLILQTSTRYLKWYLLALSIWLLYRGHNMPGGGFVGGLVAAAAFTLQGMAHDVKHASEGLRIDPARLIGIGLLFAVGSGVLSFYENINFMTGLWTEINFGFIKHLHLGTPMLFDLGVYFVVLGVTTKVVFAFLEE